MSQIQNSGSKPLSAYDIYIRENIARREALLVRAHAYVAKNDPIPQAARPAAKEEISDDAEIEPEPSDEPPPPGQKLNKKNSSSPEGNHTKPLNRQGVCTDKHPQQCHHCCGCRCASIVNDPASASKQCCRGGPN